MKIKEIIIECDRCDGVGRIPSSIMGYPLYYEKGGQPEWEKCSKCHGRGDIRLDDPTSEYAEKESDLE